MVDADRAGASIAALLSARTPDLLVVGAHQRGFLSIASTVDLLVGRASCPVLVVPEAAQAAWLTKSGGRTPITAPRPTYEIDPRMYAPTFPPQIAA